MQCTEGISNRAAEECNAAYSHQHTQFYRVAQEPADEKNTTVQDEPEADLDEEDVGKIAQSLCRLLCHFPRKLLVETEFNREAYEADKGNGKIQLPKLDITQESPVCNGQE